jgi:hypothetical protein
MTRWKDVTAKIGFRFRWIFFIPLKIEVFGLLFLRLSAKRNKPHTVSMYFFCVGKGGGS